MRVLVVCNSYPTPAAPHVGTHNASLIAGLNKYGVSNKLLLFDRPGRGRRCYFSAMKRIRRELISFDPDIVHVTWGGVLAAEVTYSSRYTPTIVTFGGTDLLGGQISVGMDISRFIPYRIAVKASLFAAVRATAVTVVSENLKRILLQQVPRDSVYVFPWPIDLTGFIAIDSSNCRESLGWSKDSFHVLFSSDPCRPEKRFDIAQKAVGLLRAQGLNVELHCVVGVDRSQMPRYLNAAHVLLVTSVYEGSPKIVTEALACGTPVVSTRVGDVEQQLEGRPLCYVCDHSIKDVASHLAKVLLTQPIVREFTGTQDYSDLNLENLLMVYERHRR